MYSIDDIECLTDEQVLAAIEANLDRPSDEVALDKHIAHAAMVATQIKYLQRAREKLPSYYASRCILPPLAFQQSSSEACAAQRRLSGERAVDLTCGLGVDALYLSKSFATVDAVEADAAVARVAQINFARLGATNIRVHNMRAEEFVERAATEGRQFDLVFADPDRRNASGRKMVCLPDCSPDITALRPQLQRITDRLVLKLSPMFDVDECFRLFGDGCRVEVLSLGGECKEVDVTSCSASAERIVCATAIGMGSFESSWQHEPARSFVSTGNADDEDLATIASGDPRYLIVPDVALQKSRLAQQYFAARTPHTIIDSNDSYAFSWTKPDNVMGRIYEIESIQPYVPRQLRREFRARDCRQIELMRRNFPYSSAQILAATGVREGGSERWAFTRIDGRPVAIKLKSCRHD